MPEKPELRITFEIDNSQVISPNDLVKCITGLNI